MSIRENDIYSFAKREETEQSNNDSK